MRVKKWQIGIALLQLMFPLMAGAVGVDVYWTNTSGGVFSAPGNWLGGVMPDASDKAMFSNSGTYTVTLDANYTNRGANFRASNATINVNLAGYYWLAATNNINQFEVGDVGGQNQQVVVSNGTLYTTRLFVSDDPTTAGLTLRSVIAEVSNVSSLLVGGSGTGTLTLANAQTSLRATGGGGSTIGDDAGSYGAIIISNGFFGCTGTLYNAYSGTGLLSVNSGTSHISGSIYLGYVAGARGIVTMDGEGAYLSAPLNMGSAVGVQSEMYLSNGTFEAHGETKLCTDGQVLMVLNGGNFTNADIANHYLPHYYGTGVIVLASAQSTFYSGGALNIGQNVNGGRGEIYVSNGTFSVYTLSLGNKPNSEGYMYVYNATAVVRHTSANSFILANGANSTGLLVVADERAVVAEYGNNLQVGTSGEGTLVISNGTVNVKGLMLGNNAGSSGRVLVESGSLIVPTNTLTIGNSGPGTLILSKTDSYLENIDGTANVLMGGSAGINGSLYLSNGVARLRQLLVGNAGQAYVYVGPVPLTLSAELYIPNSAAAGGGTGVVFMASPDSFISATQGTTRIGSGQTGHFGASGSLIASNGTIWMGVTEIGSVSDGSLTLGNATATVFSTGGNAMRIGQGSGTGRVYMTHPGSRLEMRGGELWVGGQNTGGEGIMIVRSGEVVAASLQMGRGTGKKGTLEIYDASMILLTNAMIGNNINTTSTVLMAHANSFLSASNGVISVGVYTNSLAVMTMSNGTVVAKGFDVGSSTLGGTNMQAEFYMYNATNILLESSTSGNAMNIGGRQGATGIVVMGDSGALILSTNAGRVYVGNSGYGRLTISNGTVQLGGELILAENSSSTADLSLYDASLSVAGRFTIGKSGPTVMNVDHSNALITVGAGGFRVGNTGSDITNTSTLNFSNGTMRTTVAGLDHTVGGADQRAWGTGIINMKGGTLDLANGNLFLGNKSNCVGILNLSGGTVLISRLRLPAGAATESSTGTLAMSGGILYLANLDSAGKTVGSTSNLWLSGGTLRSISNFSSTVGMVFTNSPGPGLYTFDIATNTVQLSGILSGPGGFTKIGDGILALYAANTFSGNSSVTNGVLAVHVASGSGTGSGNLDVRPGGQLVGTGSVSRFSLGGGIISPGLSTNTTGRLLAGTMSWTGGVYRWDVQDFANTNWDALVGTGTLTIASGIITIKVVTVSAPSVAGAADNYDLSQGYTAVLASATSISGFNVAKFEVNTDEFQNDAGATWSVTQSGTNLLLVCTPPVSSSRRMYWDPNGTAGLQNGSGNWSSSSNAWLAAGVAPNVPWDNSTQDRAIFGGASGGGTWTASVTDVAVTNIGVNLINNGSTYSYEIGGSGELVMIGGGQSFNTEYVNSRLTISTPLRIPEGGIVKSGPGDIYLNNPSASLTGGVFVKAGRLIVGRGGVAGELGSGKISVLSGAELHFNRSIYNITNPIEGGRTYITNIGGGYAWNAGATQDFALLDASVTVTQQSGGLYFTNYFRVQSSTTNTPVFIAEGGTLYAKSIDLGYTTRTGRMIVTGSAYVQTDTLNIGPNLSDSTAGELFLSNGTVAVDRQMYLGRNAAGSAPTRLFVQDGGKMIFGAASYLVYTNGSWTQNGGVFTNPTPSASCDMTGVMALNGGVYFQGGESIMVGGAANARYARMTISGSADVRILPTSTNYTRPTALYIGANGTYTATGEVYMTGGSLIMTNALGRYFVSGIARSNNGDIAISHKPSCEGRLIVSGGRISTYQVWMGGHKMRTVSADGNTSAGLTDETANNSRAYLTMSGGELYSVRGISNNINAGAFTNISLSGGTLGALGLWNTALNIFLTNSPGPGVTRFDPNGYRMTLLGSLSGPGGLSMDGAGVLVISNNNSSLLGVSYVSNGTIEVSNPSGLGLGTNVVNVVGGGILSGVGSLRGLAIKAGGTLSPGAATNTGSLVAGNTVWSNITYTWEISDFGSTYGVGWDRFASTGSLTIASGSINTIKVTSLSAAGSYGAAANYNNVTTYTQLIASAASISGFDAGAFVLDATSFLNDEVVLTIQLVNSTNLALVVAPGSLGNNRAFYWDADSGVSGLQNGTGTWNNLLANWQTVGGVNLAWNNSRQDHAIFGAAGGSGSWTVNVAGISSATNIGMSFLPGSASYTIVGTGYLSFASAAVITASSPATVSARLEGLGFTKVGSSVLTLGGSNRYTGISYVSNGTLRITNSVALGDTGVVTVVASGAELEAELAGTVTVREPLNISGDGTNGQGALQFTAGTVTWIGTVTVAGASTRIGVDNGLTATLSTVVTGGVADVFVGGSGRLMVGGGVKLGNGKIVKDGAGVLSMRGPSSFSGGTIISAGTVRVCGSCAANVMGSATILMESNTVLGSESAASSITNNLSIWGNVQLVDSTSPFNKDLAVVGTVDLNGAIRTITVPSSIATLAGPVSNGGINKKGAGTLVLGGASSYTSPTIVSNGNLILNGTNTSSTVTSISGTKLLGAGSIGTTTVNGELDAGQSLLAVGHLRATAMTLRPSSSVRVTITNATQAAGTGYDTITVAGTLNVASTAGGGECTIIPDSLGKTPVNFNNASVYTWKIISAGTLSGYAATKFTVSTASFSPALGGGYFSVIAVGNDLYLKFLPSTSANLKISVVDSPDPVGLSNSITYSITVSNLSQLTASPDMVISNYLDDHSTYLSSSAGGSHSAGVVTWSISSLAGGFSTTVTAVARADIYGFHTNVAHVSTEVPDAVEDDNWATNITEVTCVSSLPPTFNTIAAQSVVANQTLTFTITAYDSGCYPPSISATGLPVGASFVNSNQYPLTQLSYGTVTWTPGPSQTGTHPFRFTAVDADDHLTSLVLRVYVAGIAEPTNSAGVPQSQTNWHVVITNLSISGGNDAQVIWTSSTGITYDVYTSVGSLGNGGISWQRDVNAHEASGSLSTSTVTTTDERRFFKVVLENEGVRDSNGIWAVFRPTIAPGFNLFAPPLYYTNLSIAGELGDNLAAVLTGDNSAPGDGQGDEILLLLSNGSTYKRLYLDGGNPAHWRDSGGLLATDVLQPGQGMYILRNSGSSVQPTFVAPVGNLGIRTNTIVEGFNLLGVAEGWYNMTFNRVFTNLVSGSVNNNWDEQLADQIMVLNSNGSYSRFWRAPDGWRNAATDALATTNTFIPGRSYFYKRVIGTGQIKPKF